MDGEISPDRLRPSRLREMTEGGEVCVVQVMPTQLQGLVREVFEVAQVEREFMGSWMEDLKLRRRSDSVCEAEVRMRSDERRGRSGNGYAVVMAMGNAVLFFMFLCLCFGIFGGDVELRLWSGKWWKEGVGFFGFLCKDAAFCR